MNAAIQATQSIMFRAPVEGSVLIDRACGLLGVSRRTIYYWIREGRLRTIRTRGGSQRILLASIQNLSRPRARRAEGRRASDAGPSRSFDTNRSVAACP